MVRVDRDLKRCYFYRLKIEGDVRKPAELREESPEFPRSGVPRQDIVPYNPHFRKRVSRQASRPTSTRRISWSREADRVREISPRSEPEKIFYPPPARQNRSYPDTWQAPEPEEKYPLEPKKIKKKKKVAPKKIAPRNVTPPTPEPTFEPIYTPPKPVAKHQIVPKTKSSKAPKTTKDQNIRKQRDQRYQVQKLEQNRRKTESSTNLRKVKSESNLRAVPKEPLMKKSETGKSKHFNPPRWRHVGDRTRHRQIDKNTRSFASDYYF